MNMSKPIISILKRLKSAKARDIAMELSKLTNRCFAKNVVNDILHNQINDIVEHDDHFYWSLKPNFETIPFNCTETPERVVEALEVKQTTEDSCDCTGDADTKTASTIYNGELVDNVISLNSTNTLSIVGIARRLQKPATVIYKILRENDLLKTNAKDTLWYKEVTIPAELRTQLKSAHITFGLWCSSLKISPVSFANVLESRLLGNLEPSELEFALDALNHDFPSVFNCEIEAPASENAVISAPEPRTPLKSILRQTNDQPPDVATNTLFTTPASDNPHLVSIISFILHSQGVSDVGSIISEVVAMHADTYSGRSIEAELSVQPEFIKFAPGIYGLSEHLDGFGVSTSNLLLNDHDCRLYIMARYAGEVFGAFPLWTASMEYKWYTWLEKHPNTELRDSFYYIASPEDWPVNKKTAEELSYKISAQADTYYLLREPKYHECTLPDINNLCKLIGYVKERGTINWIAANRLLGRRIDDYTIVAEMALLVCLGVIEPAFNWQRAHAEASEALEIGNVLSAMLKSDPKSTWSGRAGELLLDTFTININTQQMGWVDVTALNKLFFDASKRNINLISEESLTVESPLPVTKLPLIAPAKERVVEHKIDKSAESLLRALKVALNPENLISDGLWDEWSQKLSNHSISVRPIATIAADFNLPWPAAKEYECLDKYLGMPLNKIFKLLGWKSNRTLLLCVANLALTELPHLKETVVPKTIVPPVKDLSVNLEVSFDELFRSEDPLSLISDEIWNKWVRILMDHPFRTRLIADIVDDLGSLFWQARWKDEKILNYCLYSLDELYELKYPGKNRTIVICVAKVANEALAKLNRCTETSAETIKDDLLADREDESSATLNSRFNTLVKEAPPVPETVPESPSRNTYKDSSLSNMLLLDDLKLDLISHSVFRGPTKLAVTNKEFQLLRYLMQNPCTVISREQINVNVYDGAIEKSSRIIDLHICNLRTKIDKTSANKLIHTIRGEGYMVQDTRDAESFSSYNPHVFSHTAETDFENSIAEYSHFQNEANDNNDELLLFMDDDDTITLS